MKRFPSILQCSKKKKKKKEKGKIYCIQEVYSKTDFCVCVLFKQLVTKWRFELHTSADIFHKHNLFVILCLV